jgi:pyridoxamine 5'-phosphate oxidase
MWEELSPATRATFFWPTPGVPKGTGEFPATVADDAKPPANFAVIMVNAIEAELLELSPHPHRRRRWKRSANWAVEELNP